MKTYLFGNVELSKINLKTEEEEKKIGEVNINIITETINSDIFNHARSVYENSARVLIGFHNSEKILEIIFRLSRISISWHNKTKSNKESDSELKENLKEVIDIKTTDSKLKDLDFKNVMLDLKGKLISEVSLEGIEGSYKEFVDLNEFYFITSVGREHCVKISISYNFIVIAMLKKKNKFSITKSKPEDYFHMSISGFVDPWDFYNPNALEMDVGISDMLRKIVWRFTK